MHADDLIIGLLVIVHRSCEVVEGLCLGIERAICLARLLTTEYRKKLLKYLDPLVPDEKTMRIIILWMKVVCIHG